MNIAIDMSPLKSGHYLQHRVRGTGFYLQNLKYSLEKYFPENNYSYFSRGESIGNNVNIVHYPYFEPFFLTLPLFSKNKRVVTVHDLIPLVFPENFKTGFKGSLKWLIQKSILKNVNCIITDSESSKKDIIKYVDFDQNKIKVVYLAASQNFRIISSRTQMEKVRKKYNLPEKFLLYVGDATWNKNLPRLLEAVSKINAPLFMAGRALTDRNIDLKNPWNSDLAMAQELAEKHKNIFRLGFVPTEDLVYLYNAATLFIMPSIYEGFGLPVLEAMSCGCPVVTSDGGSLKEIAGEAAVYVDPYNVNSIAKGIREMFNDNNLREKFSKKGLTQSKKFNWQKTASGTIAAYNCAISS